jgi:hypothetical protein
MPTESMVDIYNSLTQAGYTDQCRATPEGLRFLHADAIYDPEDVQVDKVIRLEGNSVPSEEVVIFALRSPDGAQKCTYSVSHGADMDPIDADMLQRLPMGDDAHDRLQPPVGTDAGEPLRLQF